MVTACYSFGPQGSSYPAHGSYKPARVNCKPAITTLPAAMVLEGLCWYINGRVQEHTKLLNKNFGGSGWSKHNLVGTEHDVMIAASLGLGAPKKGLYMSCLISPPQTSMMYI